MYNLVNLIGRLTHEPELDKTETGKNVCHIQLAVQRTYKNPDGIYEADFIRCTLWETIADKIVEYCHKGDLIAVRGQLRTSSYIDNNNEKKYSSEVMIEKIVFLTSKSNNEVIEADKK